MNDNLSNPIWAVLGYGTKVVFTEYHGKFAFFGIVTIKKTKGVEIVMRMEHERIFNIPNGYIDDFFPVWNGPKQYHRVTENGKTSFNSATYFFREVYDPNKTYGYTHYLS